MPVPEVVTLLVLSKGRNTTPADLTQVRCDLDQFKHRWRTRLDGWKATGEGALEKKYAQSFWSDFLACFGINAARMDLFEQDARRGSSGNSGYIDLFWPSVVIGEAKSPVLLQSWARVEKPNLKTLVVLAPGCLSCLEYPADDHRVRVRLPVSKHRPLAFP
ncbi:type IIL restriction-modification enzyme MmeI (plasmid) [Corynebacterium sp. S7]